MKKFIYILMTFLILLFVFIGQINIIFADEVSENISFEEYSSTITSEAAKYGIQLEVDKADPSLPVIVTRKMLDEAIWNIRKNSAKILNSEIEMENFDNPDTSVFPYLNTISPTAVINTYFFKGTHTVRTTIPLIGNIVGSVEIMYNASADYEINKDIFIHVNDYSHYDGHSLNFDSFSGISEQCSISNDKLIYSLSGNAKFAYTTPFNVVYKETVPFYILKSWRRGDSI